MTNARLPLFQRIPPPSTEEGRRLVEAIRALQPDPRRLIIECDYSGLEIAIARQLRLFTET
jgi:DNA-directed RNA polymerase specialized sigma24 family protein